jgi:ATP-dependent exoDNAse (exonuclease V) beta subunit
LSWELPRPAGRDAVTLMTIHKAKGLGFPVVIVLLYDWKNKGGKPALLETESGAEILKLVQGWERHELLRQLKAESEMQYRADELNKLYVALTRAKSEMYVTVVTENPAKPPGLFLRPTRSSDQRPKIERLQPMERTTAPTRFADRDSAFPEEQEGVLRDRETLRGERVHEVLSHLTVTGEMDRDLDRAFERAAKQLNEAEQQKLREVIRSFLSEANVANLFENADGRVVWCERDVSDRNGRLFRIDRLIVDPDNITIVDFKTGARKNEEEYRSQVLQYMGICKELYPGRVIRGMLAYVDQRILVDVA